MRKAAIWVKNTFAGYLTEDGEGYHFQYTEDYLQQETARAVSLTLPLQKAAYHSGQLFPFFDGLIPEGWMLEIAETNWKLNPRDRMGLLLACCKDCIGDIRVEALLEEEA